MTNPFEQLKQTVYLNPTSFVFETDKANSGDVFILTSSAEPVNGSEHPGSNKVQSWVSQSFKSLFRKRRLY